MKKLLDKILKLPHGGRSRNVKSCSGVCVLSLKPMVLSFFLACHKYFSSLLFSPSYLRLHVATLNLLKVLRGKGVIKLSVN
jgi:hypothetical protein